MTAYQEGRDAFLLGKVIEDNPYKEDVSWMGLEWAQGWQDAKDHYHQP